MKELISAARMPILHKIVSITAIQIHIALVCIVDFLDENMYQNYALMEICQ